MHTQIKVGLVGDKSITVVSEDDIDDHIEHAKQLRALEQKSDWGRHVASIPNIVLVQWLNEEWQRGNGNLRPYSKEFDELIARKLKDPDWAFLRVDGPTHNVGWGS